MAFGLLDVRGREFCALLGHLNLHVLDLALGSWHAQIVGVGERILLEVGIVVSGLSDQRLHFLPKDFGLVLEDHHSNQRENVKIGFWLTLTKICRERPQLERQFNKKGKLTAFR